MSITLNVQTTIQEMELKRMQLQSFAQQHGFTHPDTVLLSQELDDLFNVYHQLNQK
ncbi:MAG: Spo0E family sporulation regulatory protein-aspartic acid phosphatase [Bacillota bacterium]